MVLLHVQAAGGCAEGVISQIRSPCEAVGISLYKWLRSDSFRLIGNNGQGLDVRVYHEMIRTGTPIGSALLHRLLFVFRARRRKNKNDHGDAYNINRITFREYLLLASR